MAWNQELALNGFGDPIDEVDDRIRVVARRVAWPRVIVVMRWIGQTWLEPALGNLRNVEAIATDDKEPSEIPDCDTGEDEIDNTADLREQLMAKSLQDPDNPLEHGGLFWPDGNGGYDLLEYGVEIPGGVNHACRITSPPLNAFPQPGTWPSGVIFFHTQPYSYGEQTPCGPYGGGPSDGDRQHLRELRFRFERNDIAGMILDKDKIIMIGDVEVRDQTIERCK